MPVMLDIETTGLDRTKDDVLQIAALKLSFEHDLYKPAGEYSRLLPTQKEPSAWAKKNPAQVKLYEKCHNLDQYIRTHETGGDMVSPPDANYDFRPNAVREQLTSFLGPKAEIVGLNVTTFDLKFLEHKGYLLESDYHYQVFDMTGIIEYLMRVLKLPSTREARDQLKTRAKEHGSDTVVLPVGLGAHEGLYDCYDQTRELNGYILMAREGLKGLTT